MEQIEKAELNDLIFFLAAIIFNVAVSLIYLSTKFENTQLRQVSGAFVIAMIIPFSITFYSYFKQGAGKNITISHVVILFYLVLEVLLDYILLIPFRDIPVLHVPYIIIFYAAEFSIIGVVFDRNRKMGFVVLATFFVLLGCLVYLLVG